MVLGTREISRKEGTHLPVPYNKMGVTAGGYNMVKKKTHVEFVDEVFNKVGHDYSVIGKYKRGHDKIEIKHTECRRIFKIRANAFLYGVRCSHCFRPEKRTQKEFEKEVFELVNDEYSVLGSYESNHVKVLMKHNTCGYEYGVTPGHFFTTGRRCPKCNGGISRKGYNLNEHVREYSGGEYESLSEYTNSKVHVKMKHVFCGHIWTIKPDNFFYGKGCPACNESLGEREIRKYLTKNNMSFQGQYKFDDCKNERSLPFDFAITSSKKVISLIEFQGEQHYRSVPYFGGVDGYKKRVKNDNIKLEYCKTNNIPLLAIKYDEDIEMQLNDFLKYYANPEPSALETV